MQVKNGEKVIILEKMNSLGKKLCITGKGRCNITSSLPIEDFIKNIPGNGKFLYSALNNFTNEERGNRVFPITDSAKDVLKTFLKILKKYNVKIITDERVIEILKKDGEVHGVRTEKKVYNDEKVVLATGGKSYPMTGSNGDGYILAKKMGHTITEIRPSLVALTSKNESLEVCQALQGLSLKNVGVKLIKNGKNIYEDFGEMLFTHFGVSGPTILSSSAHLVRKGIENTKLVIDLKPALSDEKLDERIIRDFNEEKNKEFKNSLEKLLPKKLIPLIISKMGLEKKVNEVTKEERKKLVNILKRFEIEISGFRPVEEAIVTAGGVSIKEINPKTMESKLVKGLYFAGEIIDVDAYTGGFNLQIAYSTGYTAGLGM